MAWEKTRKTADDGLYPVCATNSELMPAATALPQTLGLAIEQYLLGIGVDVREDRGHVGRRPFATSVEEVVV